MAGAGRLAAARATVSVVYTACYTLHGVCIQQQARHESSYQSDLKAILTDLVPHTQAEVKEFRSQHGSKVMGEVTVDMVSV